MRKHILALGDIHGRFQEIRDLYQHLISDPAAPQPEETDLILLGDFGGNFWYSDPMANRSDDTFKKKLEKYKFNYIILRGNHEQRPSCMMSLFRDKWDYFYDEDLKGKVYVEKQYPYIKYLDDMPALYDFAGLSVLTFPGAYSVDKKYRLARGWSWFPGEQLTPEEMEIGWELVRSKHKVDLVLSHTCPQVYEPTDLFLSMIDQTEVDKTMERYLNQIEFSLEYRLWCFGHYHATRVYPEYEEKQTVMLFNDAYFDINEFFLTKDPYGSLHSFHLNRGA